MGVLHELQQFLVASTALGLKDPLSTGPKIPVYTGRLPASTGPAVGLYSFGGLPPVAALAQSTPVTQQPTVQVLVRSSEYGQAESVANAIHDLLFATVNADLGLGLGSTSTGTSRWLVAMPNQPPYDMGKDALGRDMLTANYAIMRTP